MSSRKGSSKRHSSSHSSSGDSSANEVITPKEEFEVEEDAKDAYYNALCRSLPPLQDIPIPKRPVRSPNAPLTPSMVSPDYLTTLRNFYQIPSGVVFRIPSGDESARNPPEGFFSCYEAFLAYCRIWFPIEGRVRQLWDSIEVSEDTAEAGAGAADEEGEVNQPVSSFGVSMSGYLDLDF
ncbi:hypothetical protein Bca4012_058410 [Brassica carinata]